MREAKKYHKALRLTQEGSNSPRRDTGHSFQPKEHMETSNGSEYPVRPFTNLLMSSCNFLSVFSKGEKHSTVKEKKNVAKIISLTYNLDRC